MFETSAVFSRKEPQFETTGCVVEKVIRLSDIEYMRFSTSMLREQDFIRDNIDLMIVDADNRYHCLLVVGEGRSDGILVHSSGYDYARFAAYVPNADGLLTVGRYSALADLNKKLTDLVDIIAEHVGEGKADGRGVINIEEWDETLGFDLAESDLLRSTDRKSVV